MKKILMGLMLLSLLACANREVRMTDPELEMQGIELHYQGRPFTGTLVQQIPLTDSKIKIKYKDGIPKAPNIKE